MGREPRSEILPGVCLDQQGKVVAEPHLQSSLQHIAIELSDATHLPIEVDHVLEALQLACQAGAVSTKIELSAYQSALITTLSPFAKNTFWQSRERE